MWVWIIIIIIIVLRFALGRAGPSTALCTGEKPYCSIRVAEPPYAHSRVKKTHTYAYALISCRQLCT